MILYLNSGAFFHHSRRGLLTWQCFWSRLFLLTRRNGEMSEKPTSLMVIESLEKVKSQVQYMNFVEYFVEKSVHVQLQVVFLTYPQIVALLWYVMIEFYQIIRYKFMHWINWRYVYQHIKSWYCAFTCSFTCPLWFLEILGSRYRLFEVIWSSIHNNAQIYTSIMYGELL